LVFIPCTLRYGVLYDTGAVQGIPRVLRTALQDHAAA